jgi:histidinol phosphatase-like enzyme
MIIYVDIDETICEYPDKRMYELAVPIKQNIEKLNRLYDDGNTIVYWTARGTVTGLDFTDLTNRQLNEWGAKHHEIKLGKPHYDVFICDKAINSVDFFKEQQATQC